METKKIGSTTKHNLIDIKKMNGNLININKMKSMITKYLKNNTPYIIKIIKHPVYWYLGII